MAGNKKKIDPSEAIMNLLIVKFISDGMSMKTIEKATGIDEKTLYGKFPASIFKGEDGIRQKKKK